MNTAKVKSTDAAPATSGAAPGAASERPVVAVYRTHEEAEKAVRSLAQAGIPMTSLSIVGRDFRVREDVQGYFRPADAAKDGAGSGAWVGGLFGLLWGFGVFVFPVAGPLLVLGPLAGLVAGAVAGAGIGALVEGLISLGIPRDSALKYRERLEAGEFLLVVHGTAADAERAEAILWGGSAPVVAVA